MIGIYRIKNIINDKVYIGSSIDVSKRLRHHKNSLIKGNHHSIKLQRSYNIVGEESFVYEIVEECDIENLLMKEQYYIDLFDSYKNGYNSLPVAGNNTGLIHSEETKDIIREHSR